MLLALMASLAMSACDRCGGSTGEGDGVAAHSTGEPPRADRECGPGRLPPPRVPANPRPVQRLGHPSPSASLLTAPHEIKGRRDPRRGVIAEWRGDALRAWRLTRRTGAVAITSPAMPVSARAASRIVLRFRSPAATELKLTPVTRGGRAAKDWDSRFRTLVLPISDVDRVDGVVTVAADVGVALRGNWEDANRRATGLHHLELALEGARLEDTELLEVTLESDDARFREAAGVATVDRGAVLHPSWYVQPGVVVKLRLSVPSTRPELRFYGASTAGGAELVARIVDLGGPGGQGVGPPAVTAPEATPATPPRGSEDPLVRIRAGARWSHRRVPLDRWAGKEVTLALSSEGPGVALFGAPSVVSAAPQRRAPDVIVYLVDTLLATQLGAWGNPISEELSPTMDRLAHEGMTFGFAMSIAPWTKPAIPSLMTGLHEAVHRVGARTYTERLPATVPLLQERFGAAGFRTGSFAASPLGTTMSGLERGFDTAVTPGRWDHEIGPMAHPTAEQVHRDFLAWVDEAPDRPYFAYIHTLDVHEHYRPMFRQNLPAGWHPYEKAIQQQDTALSSLFADLRRRGRDRDLVVVLVSDHGEAFGTHGHDSHGYSLYQSQLHVPLVFWSPSHLPAMTVNHPVSLVDVPATLIDLFGLPALPMSQGASLLPYAEGRTRPLHEAIYASRLWYIWRPNDPPWHAMIFADSMKAMLEGDRAMVFSLAEDPCERVDVAGRGAELVERLRRFRDEQSRVAAEFDRRYGRAESAAIDADEVERLRALGYIEDGQ